MDGPKEIFEGARPGPPGLHFLSPWVQYKVECWKQKIQ